MRLVQMPLEYCHFNKIPYKDEKFMVFKWEILIDYIMENII